MSKGPPFALRADTHVRTGELLHVLTFVTAAYLHWLRHLAANLRLLGLPAAALTVCAGDGPSLAFIRDRGFNAVDLVADLTDRAHGSAASDTPGQTVESYGTASYLRIVHAKSLCISRALDPRFNWTGIGRFRSPSVLLVTDGDVSLFSDPRAHFLSLGVDMALMQDSGASLNSCRAQPPKLVRKKGAAQRYNSGFVLMRPGPATRLLWEAVLVADLTKW